MFDFHFHLLFKHSVTDPYEYPKKRQPNRKHYTTGDIQELNDRRIEDQLDFKLNLGRNSRELRNKTRSFTKFFENGTERNYDNLIKSNEDVTSSEDLGYLDYFILL